MISDENSKVDIDSKWNAIQKLENNLRPWTRMTPSGDVITGGDSPDESYNLILVLAYSLLDEVLSQLIRENILSDPEPNRRNLPLGRKMEAARTEIDWTNYPLVYEGKETRNNLAHQGILAEKDDCIKYAYAIKRELDGWGFSKMKEIDTTNQLLIGVGGGAVTIQCGLVIMIRLNPNISGKFQGRRTKYAQNNSKRNQEEINA